jgi:hypothetical protein
MKIKTTLILKAICFWKMRDLNRKKPSVLYLMSNLVPSFSIFFKYQNWIRFCQIKYQIIYKIQIWNNVAWKDKLKKIRVWWPR